MFLAVTLSKRCVLSPYVTFFCNFVGFYDHSIRSYPPLPIQNRMSILITLSSLMLLAKISHISNSVKAIKIDKDNTTNLPSSVNEIYAHSKRLETFVLRLF